MNDIVRQIGPDVAGPIWRYQFRRNPGYFIIYNWRVGRRQGVRSRRSWLRRPVLFAGLRLRVVSWPIRVRFRAVFLAVTEYAGKI